MTIDTERRFGVAELARAFQTVDLVNPKVFDISSVDLFELPLASFICSNISGTHIESGEKKEKQTPGISSRFYICLIFHEIKKQVSLHLRSHQETDCQSTVLLLLTH